MSKDRVPRWLREFCGLLLIAGTLPGLFWLKFGRVDGFASAFTAFVLLLVAAANYLPRWTERVAADKDLAPPPKPYWFDKLGCIWALAIPFAPAAAWFLTNMIGIDRSNWQWMSWMRVVLCIAVPLFCVLPLLRYLRRGTVTLGLTVIVIGTAFPVITALGAVEDLAYGPTWQDVVVAYLDRPRLLGHGPADDAHVSLGLADGRWLLRSADVPLRTGPARLLVLDGAGYAIERAD